MPSQSIPQLEQLQQAWQKEKGYTPQAWDGFLFRRGCAQMRKEARAELEEMDAWLLMHKPAGWQVVGRRPRTVVTRFGDVTFYRRLYRDEQGQLRFLLDEVLGLPAHQGATREVREAVVAVAAETSYARAAVVLALLTAAVLSPSTIWRVAQQVGEAIEEAEGEEAERVFGQGAEPRQVGERGAERLYIEADGVMVRRRTGEGRTVWREVRMGVAYDDAGQEQVYAQGPGSGDFWERASLSWGAVWDWRQVGEVVLSGDDAVWIEDGRWLHERVIRQLDGFHIARAAYRAAGAERGAALGAALQAGAWEEVARLWAQVPEPDEQAPQRQRQAWEWLNRHRQDPRMVRWWRQKGLADAAVETLGHIESHVRSLIAHRMKGKGRHWSAHGLRALVKIRQEIANGRLGQWCGRLGSKPHPASDDGRSQGRTRRRGDPGAWLQAHVPLLAGPVPTSPTLLRLRHRLRLN